MEHDRILQEIAAQLDQDQTDYPTYQHGWAIMCTELNGLFVEISKRRTEQDRDMIRHQAIRVAAAAVKFATGLC
jgi:hypothetical protein